MESVSTSSALSSVHNAYAACARVMHHVLQEGVSALTTALEHFDVDAAD